MATKKAKSTETVETVETVEKVTKAKEPINLVTMADGSQIAFGSKRKVVNTYDLANNKVIFRLINGVIISWDISPLVEDFSELQKKIFSYGLSAKVKNFITLSKTEDLEKDINTVIEEVKNGIFTMRGTGEKGTAFSVLSKMQIAWAKYLSSKADGDKLHWVNVDREEVIEEILEAWKALSKEELSKVRKNPYIKRIMIDMDIEEEEGK